MNIKKLFGFEIAHIGINYSDIYEAKKNAEIFCYYMVCFKYLS